MTAKMPTVEDHEFSHLPLYTSRPQKVASTVLFVLIAYQDLSASI
jgi:hypothetical protein